MELQKRMTRRDGSTMSLAQSKRASEVQKDINAWEENRLFTSGVVRAREVHLSWRLCLLLSHTLSAPSQTKLMFRAHPFSGRMWLVKSSRLLLMHLQPN